MNRNFSLPFVPINFSELIIEDEAQRAANTSEDIRVSSFPKPCEALISICFFEAVNDSGILLFLF